MSSVAEKDYCPACDISWAYDVDGKRFSRVVGVVVADRIAYWSCPNCGTQWERNATGDET